MPLLDFDAYAVLGVSPTAEPEAIAGAYRALAHKYHPDRNPGDAEAAERMKAVNAAHDVLSDPDRRRAYDRERAAEEQRVEMGAAATSPPPRPRKPATRPPVTEAAASCAVCGRAVPSSSSMCHRCTAARSRQERRRLVEGPALWLAGLAALAGLLWIRFGPEAVLAASVLALGALGCVRTAGKLSDRAGKRPTDVLLVLGWRGAWLAALLFLPVMPFVGLGSLCAAVVRLAVRWHRLRGDVG
jgi:predicted nucleic acid-binding Zn ribbon protein